MKKKQAIQLFIIFVVGGFFLYFVFKGIAWSDLKQKLAAANYSWIALGMGIGVLSHWIRAWRATLLYAPMGYAIPVKSSFYAVMTGYMMNYLIPRAGELSRCAALTKSHDLPVEKSLGTVVTERLVDMLMLLLILVGVFTLNFSLLLSYLETNAPQSSTSGISLKWLILGFAVIILALIYLLRKRIQAHPFYTKIASIVTGFMEGLLSIKQVKQPILFIILSILIWVCYILMMYFCLFAMPTTANLTFMNTVVVFAVGTVGMIIPAPAAGAGTYHFAVMQSLMLFGVPEADGIAYATIVHGVQMVVLVLIGAVCSIPLFLIMKKA